MATETKGIKKNEEELWQEYLAKFKVLIGPEELELVYKQGEIVAQIWKRWQGYGLNQLSSDTGLSAKRIQEVWRLYQTFSPDNWDKEVSCRFHIIIAWNYQLALMRDGGFKEGYSSQEWLQMAKEMRWNEDILEQRMEVYYGIFDFSDLSIAKELLQEESDWEIHPIVKERLKTFVERKEKEEVVSLSSGLHLFVVITSWEIVASDKEKALEEVRELMKKADFSQARFAVREKK